MKKIIVSVVVLGLLGILGQLVISLPAVQDKILDRGTAMIAERGAQGLPESDSLRVFVCGSASPLGMGQAQACIAVVTPEHFYLIDSGAGSTDNIVQLNLPTDRLNGILISHFHSDHIAEIYEVNLNSWVTGRKEPLLVIGPEGVSEVIKGINTTYQHDRHYRSTHHGESLLPPHLGLIDHQTVMPGVIISDGDLKITAYRAEHPPIEPGLGYRIDYRGRSVVISGDSNVTAETQRIVEGADLLLHDALSVPTVSRLSDALGAVGRSRTSKIVEDVLDYHASTESLIALGNSSDVGMVAFYHLVPVPANPIIAEVFMRETPNNFVLTTDLMGFELPIGSDEIIVNKP
ncbi:MAG: MBL fold metallo-hydrolase [Luminiphilus sp.]|nr:MBL fold metallo-hydrolase [Luminiphilus sp.]